MPCQCDYTEPSRWEIELSRVCCCLDELNGDEVYKGNNYGIHHNIYTRRIKKADGDALVDSLCTKIRGEDITKYSLEMQIWWRDHQKEQDAIKKEQERQDALSKLTDYERKLLNLQFS